MPERISEELFDQFRGSTWPRQFSELAQTAHSQGVSLDELRVFSTYEVGLTIMPPEDKEMLDAMGITEPRLWREVFLTPDMRQDGFRGDPNEYVTRYSEFGKQVIMACENLFTPKEHDAANEEARPILEKRLAEICAILGE